MRRALVSAGLMRARRRSAMRPGMTIDDAAAAIFAIGHPETYRALVLDGDWDEDRWAKWLQATLEAALLIPG